MSPSAHYARSRHTARALTRSFFSHSQRYETAEIAYDVEPAARLFQVIHESHASFIRAGNMSTVHNMLFPPACMHISIASSDVPPPRVLRYVMMRPRRDKAARDALSADSLTRRVHINI
jgi:hypothetical protein